MKPKYKLKSWAVICVYIMVIGAVVGSLFLVGKTLQSALQEYDNLSYVYRGLIEPVEPVVTYTNAQVIKPFTADEIEITTNFYDMNADAKIQEKSLILYGNTYMQNTGILYAGKETFDILCVMDGTVESVTTDELMGNIVTVKHSNNLMTIYQSLNEVNVIVGATLKQGDIIGTSGVNKVKTGSENMLLFEVIYNGTNINPESFYQMNLKDLS